MGTPGSGPSRGPAPARPPTWARWTRFSRSHQPDSPRGRLRRQTAMHRAPPPAQAPQPACAIARPPARSLPRAISRFQGRRTFLSSRRASPGPRNPYTKYRARSTPHPESQRPPSYLSWFPGPGSPGGRALNGAPQLPARVTQGPRGRAPGEGVMTSRRPGQGLGAARGPGGRYSNEKPPPVPPRDSVHLRPEAGARRSPRPRGLHAVSSAACGPEGALQEPGRTGGAPALGLRSLSSGLSPRAAPCALRAPSASPCAVRRRCLRSSSQPPEGSTGRY